MSRVRGKLRQRVLGQATRQCEYCRSPQDLLSDDLEIDHILPKPEGGVTTEDNLCVACRKCNELKGVQTEAIDPETGKMAPLFHPRTQLWKDHFSHMHQLGEIARSKGISLQELESVLDEDETSPGA